MPKKREKKLIIDKLKPAAEVEVPTVQPEMLEQVNVLELGAQMLKEEGVEYIFGMTAGGVFSMEAFIQKAGIKRVHVRHEQTATFAADAWGRLTRRPGVALIGPGTGLTNASTGVCQGYAAGAPMVIIVGESGTSDDDGFMSQGIARSENQLRGLTKWVRRVTNPSAFLFQLKRAFRSAVTAPTGPCAVAYPYELSMGGMANVPRMAAYRLYTPGFWEPRVWRTQADPALVEKALTWLLAAEKPTMIVGHALHQDDAQEELREFVHLLGIPCHARRIARGAIPEYDPLNVSGRARGAVMRASDRSLVMGLRIGYLENGGRPPFWGTDTRYIQAQSCPEMVDFVLATEHELVGNIKMILRQFIECAKDMGIRGPLDKWSQWRQFVVDTREEYYQKTIERTEKMRGKMPLHPDLVGRLIAEFFAEEYQDDYTAVIDGFTASSYFTDWNRAIYSGQVLDAAETIGIGHGIGMAIAAGLATNRSKPVFVLLGDGAIGAAGMDIETASRWNIPAVFLHENNDTMISGLWKVFYSKAFNPTGDRLLDSWETLPGIRHDRMFKEFGCHTEFVERDHELRPALKRACDFAMSESKPAFIEVFVDPDVLQEIWGQSGAMFSHFIKWNELPEEGQRMILEEKLVSPATLPMLDPSWQEPVRRAYEEGR